MSSANSRKESLVEELSLFEELMISFQQRYSPLFISMEERNCFHSFLRSLKTLKVFGVLVEFSKLLLLFLCMGKLSEIKHT